MYYAERKAEKARKAVAAGVRYQIEMDSLKEGIRVVMKNKVVNEWIAARQMYYKRCKELDKPVSDEIINTQEIDAELDFCILEAFETTVDRLKESVGLAMSGSDLNLI